MGVLHYIFFFIFFLWGIFVFLPLFGVYYIYYYHCIYYFILSVNCSGGLTVLGAALHQISYRTRESIHLMPGPGITIGTGGSPRCTILPKSTYSTVYIPTCSKSTSSNLDHIYKSFIFIFTIVYYIEHLGNDTLLLFVLPSICVGGSS